MSNVVTPNLEQTLYRVLFVQEEDVYEVYAEHVTESDMFGFVMVEGLLFSESPGVVIDPSEEQLALEFKGAKRSFLPVHSILRIDEVQKRGVPKILPGGKPPSNVSHLPPHIFKGKDKPKE